MKRLIIRILAAILIIIAVAWILMPYYLRKALIYQHPGIGDYTHFPNRKVEKGSPITWAISKDYNKVKINES